MCISGLLKWENLEESQTETFSKLNLINLRWHIKPEQAEERVVYMYPDKTAASLVLCLSNDRNVDMFFVGKSILEIPFYTEKIKTCKKAFCL